MTDTKASVTATCTVLNGNYDKKRVKLIPYVLNLVHFNYSTLLALMSDCEGKISQRNIKMYVGESIIEENKYLLKIFKRYLFLLVIFLKGTL